MVGPIGIEPRGAPTVEILGEAYYRWSVIVRDDSPAFVARPIRVKTRKGKDYHVVRVTIPRDVVDRLGVQKDDYLLLRAKVAQWYHMLNWAQMPEVWRKLPGEVQREVYLSNLSPPGTLVAMSGSTPAPGFVMATGTSPPPALISGVAETSPAGGSGQ